MNNLEKLRGLLKRKQSNVWYSIQLGISVEEVIELKNQLKAEIDAHQTIEEEVDLITGSRTLTIQSDKPLSPKELGELAGVDNITTTIDKYWTNNKKGYWVYTLQISNKIKDFYSTKELDSKLKEIFATTNPAQLDEIVVGNVDKKALFIYIADDHTGLTIKDSLYGNEYNGSTYAKRLFSIVDKIQNLNQLFDKIYIVRLGDELDGWNARTTRYDHELGSASNKEQFDIYTTANKLFYDSLLTKGLAEEVEIITLGNSNHSGKGFSYIANKALEFWLEAKFPEVKVTYQEKFIDHIIFGNHFIALTHGKDASYMKAPMPLVLDAKTDLWLTDYYKKHSRPQAFNSLIKGDIHKAGMQYGKSGRYVNVPSIAGGSNWIEHNFGDTDPGAMLEIYEETSKDIQSIPIWFK